jgi:hypothetical protein
MCAFDVIVATFLWTSMAVGMHCKPPPNAKYLGFAGCKEKSFFGAAIESLKS